MQTQTAHAFDFGDMAKSQLATFMLMKDMGLQPKNSVQVVKEEVTNDGAVDYVQVALESPGSREALGTIRLTLRGPKGFYTTKGRSYRTLFVASGLFTGRDSVKVVNALDEIVIVGYEYPYSADQISHQPKLAYDFMHQTSAQMAAALQWITSKSYQNPYELYAVGVSLGGLFLPSALHIAETIGVPIKGSIFAFTGADLTSVTAQGLATQLPQNMLPIAVTAVKGLSMFHDAALHLPYLRGSFLTIRGTSDSVFPVSSSTLIDQLLPEPKTAVVVEGGHINTDQPEVLKRTQDAIRAWLADQ